MERSDNPFTTYVASLPPERRKEIERDADEILKQFSPEFLKEVRDELTRSIIKATAKNPPRS